jgi:hypothetical protein
MQMGCELRTAEAPLYDEGGVTNLRFLINSDDSKKFVAIVDLDDSDFIPEGEVEFWERRLGIVIPKGD